MKKISIYSLMLVLLMLSGWSLVPGNPIQKKIEKALQMFSQHFYQEKVYLQLDKDSYVAGGTLWYKAYITLERQPTQLSSILYVDLLNSDGTVLQRNKRPIKDGGAYGDFALDTSLPAGDYRIRAYTMWMRNFDRGFFFHKDIHIYHPDRGKIAFSKKDSTTFDFSVQFFPEGGHLVDSLESVVAFKAIRQNGFPIKVSGIIKTKKGKVIDTIKSVHDGMGKFVFTPKNGERYLAEMKDTAGHKKTFQLPKAKKYGVVLKVVKVDDNRSFFQVKRHFKEENLHNNFEIAAQTQGQLTYLAGIDFSKGYFSGVIPTKENPAGILQVALFSNKGTPLAERLVFVKKKAARLPVKIEKDEVSLKPRGENTYILPLPDSIQGNFSVAVTDANQVLPSPSQDNIVSNLLMTTDIKGAVFNPAWYFRKEDSATEMGLDLVMLTNGWSRFEWKKILDQQFPEINYPPEPNGLYFVGKTYNKKGPVVDANINIMLRNKKDSTSRFMFGKSEASSFFKISHLNFSDSAYIYYKATDPKHKRKPVEVEFYEGVVLEGLLPEEAKTIHSFAPLGDVNNMLEIAEDRNKIDQLISNRSILLSEVEVKGRKKTKEETLEDRYASGMFKSSGGYTFDLTDRALPFSNILQFLMGKVAGLRIMVTDPQNPTVKWRGGTPGFFVDEIPTDLDQIEDIPVDNVAFIKVIRPPFMGGFGGANGAIAIYTRKGKDIQLRPGEGLDKASVMGYTLVKEFYSPDYSVQKDQFKLPDKRATIYWNPQLKIDSSQHHLKITFYNSDIAKKLRIVVEGITENGQLVHLNKEIE